jgi:hypothetical protein
MLGYRVYETILAACLMVLAVEEQQTFDYCTHLRLVKHFHFFMKSLRLALFSGCQLTLKD